MLKGNGGSFSASRGCGSCFSRFLQCDGLVAVGAHPSMVLSAGHFAQHGFHVMDA